VTYLIQVRDNGTHTRHEDAAKHLVVGGLALLGNLVADTLRVGVVDLHMQVVVANHRRRAVGLATRVLQAVDMPHVAVVVHTLMAVPHSSQAEESRSNQEAVARIQVEDHTQAPNSPSRHQVALHGHKNMN